MKTNSLDHILNWEGSVDIAGGDQNIAREIIRVCAEDLNVTRETLSTAYSKQDTQTLRHELHRVKGGVCYLEARELTEALNAFHAAVKAAPQIPQDMEASYQALLTAISNFQHASETLLPK